MKKFALTYLQGYERNQVAVFSYSDSVKKIIDFTDVNELDLITSYLKTSKAQGGQRDVASVLRELASLTSTKKSLKIVLFSSGKNPPENLDTLKQISSMILKKASVTVVGVGEDVDTTGLEIISGPHKDIILITTPEELPSVFDKVDEGIGTDGKGRSCSLCFTNVSKWRSQYLILEMSVFNAIP